MYYAAAPQPTGTRIGGVLAVLALNALVITGLIVGLANKTVKKNVEAIITEVIEEAPPPPEEPPPPPPPELAVPEPPKVPLPEIQFDTPPPPAPAAVQAVQAGPPTATAGPTAATTRPRLARQGVLPDYPESSRRLGEEGETLVNVCVGPDGKATRVTLKGSSGHDRLDSAAVSWLQRQRFTPGSVSGHTQEACYDQQISWRLPK